jgi:hypothetical protein
MKHFLRDISQGMEGWHIHPSKLDGSKFLELQKTI